MLHFEQSIQLIFRKSVSIGYLLFLLQNSLSFFMQLRNCPLEDMQVRFRFKPVCNGIQSLTALLRKTLSEALQTDEQSDWHWRPWLLLQLM